MLQMFSGYPSAGASPVPLEPLKLLRLLDAQHIVQRWQSVSGFEPIGLDLSKEEAFEVISKSTEGHQDYASGCNSPVRPSPPRSQDALAFPSFGPDGVRPRSQG